MTIILCRQREYVCLACCGVLFCVYKRVVGVSDKEFLFVLCTSEPLVLLVGVEDAQKTNTHKTH